MNRHVEKLAESGCKRSAGDRMWCGSCRDPHTVPAPSERVAYFCAKCFTYLQPADCERGFDCASCHMPKNSAVDAGQGVFTNHAIPRNLKAQADRARNESGNS